MVRQVVLQLNKQRHVLVTIKSSVPLTIETQIFLSSRKCTLAACCPNYNVCVTWSHILYPCRQLLQTELALPMAMKIAQTADLPNVKHAVNKDYRNAASVGTSKAKDHFIPLDVIDSSDLRKVKNAFLVFIIDGCS